MIHSKKDPHSIYCRLCGAELVWEHPKGSGHYQESSDYIGGDICRSCISEQKAKGDPALKQPSSKQQHNSAEDTEWLHLTLFQAPYAALDEHGLMVKMYDRSSPFTGPVPSQYYMPVFNEAVEIHFDPHMDPELRTSNILEHFFVLYNRDNRPNPMTSRSMSVGDVVRLEGQYYLCTVDGFTPIAFESTERPAASGGKLIMPDGTTLQVSFHPKDKYPGICIDMLHESGEQERICFVGYNPERDPGRELCIGVYCSEEEDTVYYSSYRREPEDINTP